MFGSYVDGAFTGLLADMSMASFWIGVLQIIWIDVLLAGDNAVVIALACRKLPKKMRVWGMVFGAGTAVVLRIIFTAIISVLMTVPALKIAGGLALFYIAIKLLMPDDEGHDADSIQSSDRLWGAVRIIAVADLVMSLDNVLAIAGASQGRTALFVFGLAASVPLIVAGARAVMTLLTRFPVLIWAGGALLGWIAGQVIATDPLVKGFLTTQYNAEIAHIVEYAAATVGALIVLAAGWKIRGGIAPAPEVAATADDAAPENMAAE